jgi:D-amino-acid dehydrogenase
MPALAAPSAGSLAVAVVGAGIVGVSTAIWLQRAGHRVTLIDRAGPAAGTSYGNGGVLASCSIVPVTVPGLIRKAPRMLFSPDEPLFLRWPYLPRLLPWLRQYLSHCNPADVERIAAALAPVVGDSLADHQALSAGTGAESYIVPCGYSYVYRDRVHFGGDALGWGLRRRHGFRWDELEGEAVRASEPSLSPESGFMARLHDHGRISDPGRYVEALARYVVTAGGRLVKASVEDAVFEGGKLTGLRAGGETIPCERAVFATGVWSGVLTTKLGLKVPLESERGYHLDLHDTNITPNDALMVAAKKFVITPMNGRIRLAGIVEFGGLKAAASRPPFDLLERSAKAALPGLAFARKEEWMGHRPAPADSIPLIGEVPAKPGVFLGFGHHHVGLTGGPKTGRLLAELVSGRPPNIDMTVYNPARFMA